MALVSEEKRMNFDRDIQQITHLITKEYHRGVDGNWLKRLIEEYHHPDINARGGNKAEEYHLVYQISRYIAENTLADDSYKHHLGNIDKISRYERFQHEVLHRRGFKLCIDTITADDLREFKSWLQEEHNLAGQYPLFYKDVEKQKYEQIRSENSITGYFYRIRTVVKWCIKRGLTRNNPFDQYQITQPMYGDPFYLTLEERDRVYYADLSGLGATHPIYRDIFMFQCLIGCRVSDLNRLTKANVVDGCVEYIPQKTKMEHANTVRVPLNQKALDILERYKDLEDALLPRFSHFGYNKKIKEILKYVGIDRMVRVLDPKTREDVARPLYEVATTHTARKTFIGNLYKQVKDPNLIASMSGHSEGSRAFVRYRKIDDDMKKELVNLLD
ncbi:MAG: tyrosine-type recombinase/integrase [Barnesiella intestinihominis]|uniref:site-specific integrase n=1 Tax=Barnesiella intestinihominis TaxID=487174 RepID=UPI0039919674